MKKVNNVKVMAYTGVLVAMSIILTRVVAIPIGTSIRLSVGMTPVYLAGLWLGPIAGGICGFLADFIGAVLQGFPPNPMISVTAILAGLIPGLFRRFSTKKVEIWHVLGITALHGLVGSLGFTCLGLHVYYGTPWIVLYTQRTVQTILLTALNTVLVFILYKSPLTTIITRSIKSKSRHAANHAK